MRRFLFLHAPVLLLLAGLALGALACGGAAADEVSGADADEAYVRDLCLVGKALQESLVEEALTEALDRAGHAEEAPDIVAVGELYGELLDELIAALGEITPPSDAAAFHADAIALFEEVRALIEPLAASLTEVEGDGPLAQLGVLLGALGELDAPAVPVLSEETRDRLAEAANNVPDCYGSGFLLGILGGAP